MYRPVHDGRLQSCTRHRVDAMDQHGRWQVGRHRVQLLQVLELFARWRHWHVAEDDGGLLAALPDQVVDGGQVGGRVGRAPRPRPVHALHVGHDA